MMFRRRTTLEKLCQWADIANSSFHYKAHPGPRGMKPSTHTIIGDGVVENGDVVDQIRVVLSQDYCVYGYHAMTRELRGMEYVINPKKVYRLMDENHLLCGKKIKTKGKRTFVKYRRIKASRPMEYLCLDIKYVKVQGEGKNYYQLAIIDVFSRAILRWIFQSSIRQNDVIAMMRYLDLRYSLKGVFIRNDNGSQFIAHAVRQALKDMEAKQEFTHVATPEENAYIEAFHSVEQRELIDRFDFSSFYDAKRHIGLYMFWYNNIRRHGALKWITPMQKWAQGWSHLTVRRSFTNPMGNPEESFEDWIKHQPIGINHDKADATGYMCLGEEEKSKFALSEKAEMGNAGEQPIRNNLTNGEVTEGAVKIVPSFHDSSLLQNALKNSQENNALVVNHFRKNLQLIGG
jgi:transposase InsO family protein